MNGERDRRLAAIGAIILGVRGRPATALDTLDAVAHLLIERGQLVQRHRKELADEQLEAQRAARDAYSGGLLEGLDQRNQG